MDLGDTPIENIFINDYMPMANGTYVKVSDELSKTIEEEIKKRLDLELRLAKYNAEFDSAIQSKLIISNTRLATATKHLRNLDLISEELVSLWSKGKNIHGIVLKLKNEVEITSKWLEDLKNK